MWDGCVLSYNTARIELNPPISPIFPAGDMKILVLGGDGYLGWPTSMMFATQGHTVLTVDNYLRRTMALETDSNPLFPTPVLD